MEEGGVRMGLSAYARRTRARLLTDVDGRLLLQRWIDRMPVVIWLRKLGPSRLRRTDLRTLRLAIAIGKESVPAHSGLGG